MYSQNIYGWFGLKLKQLVCSLCIPRKYFSLKLIFILLKNTCAATRNHTFLHHRYFWFICICSVFILVFRVLCIWNVQSEECWRIGIAVPISFQMFNIGLKTKSIYIFIFSTFTLFYSMSMFFCSCHFSMIFSLATV